jgi:hypothetical protein
VRVAILVGGLLVASPVASAQQPTPDACLERLDDRELTARIDMLEQRLDAGSAGARAWWYGWMFTMLAAGAGQVAWAIVTDDTETQTQRWIGATGSFLIVAGLLIRPFSPAYAAPRLRRMAEGTHAERVRKVRRGERLLRRAAEDEIRRRGLFEWAQIGAYVLTTSLLLGIHYDDALGAGLNVPVSFVVGGARILTAPQRAVRDWESYYFTSDACRAPDALDELYPTEPPAPEVELRPQGLGLALHVQFAGAR